MQKQVVALTLLLSTFIPLKAAAKNFDQLYVFGDSLSDTGNLYKLTKDQIPLTPPYFKGRFSNGPVWVETLGTKLKIPTAATKNFAVGGATTTKTNSLNQLLGVQLPSLPTQLNTFGSTVSKPSPNALYVLWVGANDYLILPKEKRTTNTQVVVNRISNSVNQLIAEGARTIVVVNLPDLGKLPQEKALATSSAVSGVTKRHNRNLNKALQTLAQQNRKVKIVPVDVNSLLNRVVANPKKYGFTNLSDSCLGNPKCTNPNQYLYWDNIHPSARAHKLIGEYALKQVVNTPSGAVSQASIGLNAENGQLLAIDPIMTIFPSKLNLPFVQQVSIFNNSNFG